MDELQSLLGESPAMESVRQGIRSVVARDYSGHRPPSVLIQGETGTGKGLVAGILHRLGPRARGPFVDVNCAAIPDTLLEAELFGYEQGAFTDARRAKPGLFQTAHRGTIFLDELALLPEALQAKLLKVIEDRSVRRLGATRAEVVDVWIVSATNADLEAAVATRRFREDLYHRLAVIPIDLPPLRERGSDIVLLAERFLAKSCADYGLAAKRLSPEALARLRAYHWPGNVRELQNAIERAALLGEAAVVGADVLPVAEKAGAAPVEAAATHDEATRQHHLAVLEQTGWNISRSAAILAVTRNTLRARIERFGLRPSGRATTPPPAGPRPVHPAPPVPEARELAEPTGAAPPELPPAPPSGLRWERRRVTAMRVAIADPEGVADIWERRRTLELLAEKILGFGGRLEALSGTGVEASFGLDPVEEAPRRAALAAMAIQKAQSAPAPGGRLLAVTTAIHTSPQLIAHIAGTRQSDREAQRAIGAMLDRLLAQASPGAIVISADSEPFLDRRFRLQALGPADAALPGGYLLLGPRATGARGRGGAAQFVGRREEMAFLESRWRASTRGHGQLVAVVGEAGVGKSRLIWEFVNSPAARDALLLQTSSAALSTATPYLPVIELLRDYFGVEAEGAASARERIAAGLLDLDSGLEAALPALSALLDAPVEDTRWASMDPLTRRARTLDAVKRLLVRRSREQPILLVFEDAHWIDSESQGVLDALVESLPTTRMLLLVACRPEYRHDWARRSYYNQIRVDPLPAADAERFLRGLIGEREAGSALEPLIIRRTEGNPFFMEETVRALVGARALIGAPGDYRLAGPVAHIEVPATVYEVLAARIDRLPPEEKSLLHYASVLGKEVSAAVLSGIAGVPAAGLGPGLAHLREAEFLYETGDLLGPEFTFTHALTQEVAYSSIIEDERGHIHVRALDVIERLYGDRLAEHLEELARHALQGHVWDKAVDYCRKAGARALARSANREAAAFLDQALLALGHLPREKAMLELAVDLSFELRNVLQPLGEFGLMHARLVAARADADALGDRWRVGRACAYLADNYRITGAHDEAGEWAERALGIAEELGDLELRVTADTYLGQIALARGEYRQAIPFFARNIDSLAGDLAVVQFGSPQPRSVHSRTCLAWCLAELGEFPAGFAGAEEALRIAQSLEHPLSQITAAFGAGYLHVRRGDVEPALAVLEPALAMTREGHSPVWFPRIASELGIVYVMAGHPREAIALLEEALERSLAMNLVSGQSLVVAALAEAHLVAGELARAGSLSEQAVQLARRHREGGHEAWALHICGAVAAAREDPRAALELFRQSLDLARSLAMRPLVAHGHLALGRAYAHLGEQPLAGVHLAQAEALLREMEMALWFPEAERALRSLG
jgi:transcriptional regulator with AAA-type ATPase domain/tetratricopeptide (TPR) repeat protein